MISVELTKQFKRIVRESAREDEVSAMLKLVRDGFGNPHAHAGIAIRKLGDGIFECRTDLSLKLIFVAQKGILTFDFAGNHDEVQNYLRDHR